jgi:hypothetical protein
MKNWKSCGLQSSNLDVMSLCLALCPEASLEACSVMIEMFYGGMKGFIILEMCHYNHCIFDCVLCLAQ